MNILTIQVSQKYFDLICAHKLDTKILHVSQSPELGQQIQFTDGFDFSPVYKCSRLEHSGSGCVVGFELLGA
ncbi:hypothetical protein FKN93_07565 [Vibrio sp. A8-1]|uniref:hypothetical protein n=1 Tax=Vibrio sp. A8-1 TaxID=2591023 RepID=UPI001482E5C5|nr:hypothetical protein [Vibrio sp. A8-1]NNN83889.1 hypothetical protein [Vibrio sp. A8-1]